MRSRAKLSRLAVLLNDMNQRGLNGPTDAGLLSADNGLGRRLAPDTVRRPFERRGVTVNRWPAQTLSRLARNEDR